MCALCDVPGILGPFPPLPLAYNLRFYLHLFTGCQASEETQRGLVSSRALCVVSSVLVLEGPCIDLYIFIFVAQVLSWQPADVISRQTGLWGTEPAVSVEQ